MKAKKIEIKKLDEELLIVNAEFVLSENTNGIFNNFYHDSKKENLNITKEVMLNQSLWDGVMYISCGGDSVAIGQFFILARKHDIIDDDILMANLEILDIHRTHEIKY